MKTPLLPVLLVATISAAHAAMIVDGFEADLHDRYDSSRFIGTAYDWSGVGRSSDGRWATALGPRYFLSANHYKPGAGSAVTFFTTNDSAGPTVERTVVSGQRIASTDLWLGAFDRDLPTTVRQYDIAMSASPDLGPSGDNWFEPYVNQPVYNVGLGSGSGLTSFRVGLNRIDLADDESTAAGLGTFDAFGMIYDEPGDTLYQDPGETRLQGGDSGGPTFAVVDGEFRLIGIHSYITESKVDYSEVAAVADRGSTSASINRDQPTDERHISFDAFVPNYAGEIAAIRAIPETSTVAPLLVLLVVGALVRRR